MQVNEVSQLAVKIALGIIMFGMGLGLSKDDFLNVFKNPKSLFIGVFSQIVLLPLVAFLVILIFEPTPVNSVGLMIVAACPGGVTSNLISHLAKADVALSISMTVFSTFFTIISIPIIIDFSLGYYMNSQQISDSLPLMTFFTTIIFTLVLPIGVGMYIKNIYARFANKMERFVKPASTIILIIVIIGVLLKQKDLDFDLIMNAAIISTALIVFTTLLGFILSYLGKLNKQSSMSIMVEIGLQNTALAITISYSLLKNESLGFVPTIYTIFMFAFGLGLILLGNLWIKDKSIS